MTHTHVQTHGTVRNMRNTRGGYSSNKPHEGMTVSGGAGGGTARLPLDVACGGADLESVRSWAFSLR